MTPAGSPGRGSRGSGKRSGGNQRKNGAQRGAVARPGGSREQRPAARKPRDAAAPSGPGDARVGSAIALGPFRLGAIPGATPGKWIDVWKDRMPRAPLELIAIEVAQQREALVAGDVDAAIVRLPIQRDGLSVIALYDETPVAVCAADSALTAVDELTLADLAGEVVIVPRDDVLRLDVPGALAPSFQTIDTTADAIATVATGVGVVIVPMSLARLHQRKDVDYRPLVDAPVSGVALAWRTDATTPLVDAFIGIVRGRTANSSR